MSCLAQTKRRKRNMRQERHHRIAHKAINKWISNTRNWNRFAFVCLSTLWAYWLGPVYSGKHTNTHVHMCVKRIECSLDLSLTRQNWTRVRVSQATRTVNEPEVRESKRRTSNAIMWNNSVKFRESKKKVINNVVAGWSLNYCQDWQKQFLLLLLLRLAYLAVPFLLALLNCRAIRQRFRCARPQLQQQHQCHIGSSTWKLQRAVT